MTLPHDAMILEMRSAAYTAGLVGGIEKTEANEAKMKQAEKLRSWMLPVVNMVMKRIYKITVSISGGELKETMELNCCTEYTMRRKPI